jgi:hypothetical protein
VAKAIHPLLGFTADNNFTQTVAFVSSLSRTTELNPRGIERLASQLRSVQPDVRDQFAALAKDVSEKPAAVALRRVSEQKNAARRSEDSIQR